MKDILVLLATMGGGLGCFLLGMKHLSEGLQSVGGAGLKRFNVAGTVILMPLFIPVVLPAVKAFFPDWAAAPAAPMAAVHTGFNIVTTLCFLPFTGPFAAFVKRIVKERKTVAEIPRFVYLDAFQQRVLAAFLAGKHLRESVLAELSVTSKNLRHAIAAARESQLQRIGGDESAPLVALRRKLGTWATHIETVRGIGYRLECRW